MFPTVTKSKNESYKFSQNMSVQNELVAVPE